MGTMMTTMLTEAYNRMEHRMWIRHLSLLAILVSAPVPAIAVQFGGGGGGGAQYAEDTAHNSGDPGTAVLCVRRDADTTLADTTGDYAPCQVDANGSLKTSLTTLISGEDQANNLLNTSGGAVRQTTVMSGVTTNTTTAATTIFTGSKTFYGQVVCSSGACTQTQAIYGDIDNDAANGILLCTLTLSGTTRTQDACPVMTANYSYYYVITTNTSGTSATGAIYAMH